MRSEGGSFLNWEWTESHLQNGGVGDHLPSDAPSGSRTPFSFIWFGVLSHCRVELIILSFESASTKDCSAHACLPLLQKLRLVLLLRLYATVLVLFCRCTVISDRHEQLFPGPYPSRNFSVSFLCDPSSAPVSISRWLQSAAKPNVLIWPVLSFPPYRFPLLGHASSHSPLSVGHGRSVCLSVFPRILCCSHIRLPAQRSHVLGSLAWSSPLCKASREAPKLLPSRRATPRLRPCRTRPSTLAIATARPVVPVGSNPFPPLRSHLAQASVWISSSSWLPPTTYWLHPRRCHPLSPLLDLLSSPSILSPYGPHCLTWCFSDHRKRGYPSSYSHRHLPYYLAWYHTRPCSQRSISPLCLFPPIPAYPARLRVSPALRCRLIPQSVPLASHSITLHCTIIA